MIVHKDSHVDHLPPEVLAWVVSRFETRSGVFTETVVLPDDLPDLDDALYGPIAGDAPVPDADVTVTPRAGRAYASRLIDRPRRKTRLVTVVAGPYQGEPCVLYTAFGGSPAPKEPTDPTLRPDEREVSERFWAVHALAR